MGWTGKSVQFSEWKYGKRVVNRKKECDYLINEAHTFIDGTRVEKSSMVGTTYYAAIRITKKRTGEDKNHHPVYRDLSESEQYVFGIVCLTSVRDGEFQYKLMDEFAGPVQTECPVSILKLLSPIEELKTKMDEYMTDFAFAYAEKWRKACEESRRNGAWKRKLQALPVNTTIEFVSRSGKKIRVWKRKLFPKDRAKWVNGMYYYPIKDIGPNFKVVTTE